MRGHSHNILYLSEAKGLDISMNNKTKFLMLENDTAHVCNGSVLQKSQNVVPDNWIEILSLESAEARCREVIGLWKKYLKDELPGVIARFEEGLKDVELLERIEKGERKYSMLYSINNEDGKCIYYEGRNPLDNVQHRAALGYWDDMPIRIKNFYEKIHDGFYHYLNRGMGLQPIQFSRFKESEPDELEWNLNYDGNEGVLNEGSHTMAFFWNSLGIAVSVDDSDESENNTIIWRSDAPCEFHAKFWRVVDQLLLYF